RASTRMITSMEIKDAMKKIRKAVFELYREVVLLRSYKTLNYTGLVKILKKYDKLSRRNGSEIYIPHLRKYNFVKTEYLEQLIQEIEIFYVINFKGGARHQAMQQLRLPSTRKKTYHFVSWRVGMYLGLAIPMIYTSLASVYSNIKISIHVSIDYRQRLERQMAYVNANLYMLLITNYLPIGGWSLHVHLDKNA
ncbi:11423_t:CDS:2, partial [Acaulospora morrowiae]